MKSTGKNIWLVCGGTGGHISPAISIFEELANQGHNPLFITLEKNSQYPSVVNLQKQYSGVVFYKASPIPKSFRFLYTFTREFLYSWKFLNKQYRKVRPDAICAFGGYPVFPALYFAVLKGIPIYLHEQNSKHGFITRLFANKARKVLLSFPKEDLKANEVFVGNPLRKSFLNYKAKKAAKKFNNVILLLGGSQGAKDINDLYLEMAGNDFYKKWKFIISTGEKDFSRIKKESRSTDDVSAFIEDIPEKMMNAKYIVCRSGSGSIYEVLWSQKPAFFIPYPFAADNHQYFNAKGLSDISQKYQTINIKPFQTKEASNIILSAITNHEKQKDKKLNQNVVNFPLNANKTIVDYLVGRD